MEWSKGEEKICCAAAVAEYVQEKSSKDGEVFLNELKEKGEFSKRDIGSMRMRLQNVKAVLDELKIENTLPFSPLSNASKQTRETLAQELKNAGIVH